MPANSIFLYVVAMIISGTIGVVVTESGLGSVDVVLVRCAVGFVAMFGYCAWSGSFRAVRYTWRTLGLTVLGGLCIVANWALFFTAYSLTSITTTTIVYQVQPFLLALLAWLLLRERITRERIWYMLIAFLGVAILTGIGPVALSRSFVAGVGLSICAAVLYSLASVIARQLRAIPLQVTLTVQLLVGTVAMAPFGSSKIFAISPHSLPYAIALGLVHTGLLYTLVYRGLQRLPVALISVLNFVYPAVAVLCDAVFYRHVPHGVEWVGIALVLMANVAAVTNPSLSQVGRGQYLRSRV